MLPGREGGGGGLCYQVERVEEVDCAAMKRGLRRWIVLLCREGGGGGLCYVEGGGGGLCCHVQI